MAALLLGRSQWTPHHPNTHTQEASHRVCLPNRGGGLQLPPGPLLAVHFLRQ